MKRSTSLKLCACVLTMAFTATALSESGTPADSQQLAQGAQSDVIVILRDQLASAPPVRSAMGERAAAVASSQRSVVGELQQGRSRQVHSFSTINAFATSVSAAEAAHLAAHPMVLAVVPDLHLVETVHHCTPRLLAASTPDWAPSS